jgi:hypothetical protein
VSLENAYMETSSTIAGIVRVLNIDYHKAGLEKNPGFLSKKPAQWFFLGFLGFLYICPEERVFRGFSVSRILLGASRC